MPKMGGVELSKLLLAERPTVCIILMSGHIFAQDIDPEFPILQKPFSPKQLKDTFTALVPYCHGAPEVA